MSRALEVHVEASRCTRCGACAALLPEVFAIEPAASRAARPPTDDERALALAARAICPTDAIRASAGDDAPSTPVAPAPRYHELATGSERVRWSLDSIAWADVDPAKAPPALRATVREMAFSENATYSATQRFLESFFDDVDFTQWMAVWFYEETRHPHVLVEWLKRVGEPVPTGFILEGRVSTPFMRSGFGTLVTNVISEVTAAQAYRHLSRTSPEPVLAGIARHISGDEARHAATFFRFARAMLASAAPDAARRDRARALEVLQAWLGGATASTHPVAQMLDRLEGSVDEDALRLDLRAVRARVVRVVGLLVDLPLRREDDVGVRLRDLLTRGRDA